MTATNGEIMIPDFRPGMGIEVTYITPDYGRPSLDLKDDYGNIVLHVNPRWDQGALVLNTLSGSWGPEERPNGFDFSSGVPISVRIEASTECFTVFVNGRIIHLYKHRMPVSSVKKAHFYWSDSHATKPARLISLSVFYN